MSLRGGGTNVWGQVCNLPKKPGKLQTCPHIFSRASKLSDVGQSTVHPLAQPDAGSATLDELKS